VSRVVVLAEVTEAGGKRLVSMSTDASGIALRPWEIGGFCLDGILQANEIGQTRRTVRRPPKS
jgi:hypothetical protein